MSCERLTTRLAILDTFKHVPASFSRTASQNISWEQNVTSCSYRERTWVLGCNHSDAFGLTLFELATKLVPELSLLWADLWSRLIQNLRFRVYPENPMASQSVMSFTPNRHVGQQRVPSTSGDPLPWTWCPPRSSPSPLFPSQLSTMASQCVNTISIGKLNWMLYWIYRREYSKRKLLKGGQTLTYWCRKFLCVTKYVINLSGQVIDPKSPKIPSENEMNSLLLERVFLKPK